MRESVRQTPIPPGVSLDVTGMPPLMVLVAEILVSDAKYTIILSSIIILVILALISRSIGRGYLVFNPLIFGLIWTLGTMGWVGLPLSMVTAGVGAMILGLGVEYSVFLVSRYEEERENGISHEDSISTALEEVGTPIIGSSATTIIGFLALTMSAMPMLRDLGLTLAIGIFYSVIASLIANPAFIVFQENTVEKVIKKMVCDVREER
jgi:uncharacterized protein